MKEVSTKKICFFHKRCLQLKKDQLSFNPQNLLLPLMNVEFQKPLNGIVVGFDNSGLFLYLYLSISLSFSLSFYFSSFLSFSLNFSCELVFGFSTVQVEIRPETNFLLFEIRAVVTLLRT